MRRTDNGLNSSRGASRANHERVLGNRRLRTSAPEASGVLVTTAPKVASASRSAGRGGASRLIRGALRLENMPEYRHQRAGAELPLALADQRTRRCADGGEARS